jgi:predicted transcriptional regulator
MEGQLGDGAVEEAVQEFAAEVARWREVRGLSKLALAKLMGFDPSYVSHMESGRAARGRRDALLPLVDVHAEPPRPISSRLALPSAP